ncbi:DNA polymerase IV [Aestuariivirga litoralis]|uniref:DNA polymerase IV n=1 Tax=Aestuariivirga litoralis TaxID=2650924 RepID=A0A2W2B5W0_9HYPH|nr:DNA polymerase IV [Aestuariivirga litoralis]PZF75508.1 DNA polymerase IV [Aestuariivirga litoralis]
MQDDAATVGFCRDCFTPVAGAERRCKACGSPRLLRHPELHQLSIAHIDCDAFYAAVEKRDRPELADKPVIVGGGTRGVVSTACYIARIHGVRSAMPMFKALKLCPEALVIKPDMAKYAAAGKLVRELMLEVTPLVEPLSIDEAFLDLTGTARLHGMSPALTLAHLIQRITEKVGITASVGLSHNKFLAKLASDLEKPRGFSVLGRAETLSFLAAKPVGFIWGVGKAMQEELARGGITMIAQLQQMEKNELMRRYGSMGARLYHLSRGEDQRIVSTDDHSKSISAETTFNTDIADRAELERILWPLAEKVSRRAKAEGVAGHTVVLKLKTADFRLRTRNVSLADPTLLASRIYDAALPLLQREATGTAFRLIGVGISGLVEARPEQETETLDVTTAARARVELAVDRIRDKFGRAAVARGIGFGSDD